MSKKDDAIVYNERGNKCRENGNWQAAIELFEQAAALAPKWSSPQYNLGLVYKYQCRWAESLEYNQRAVKLDKKDEAAWWNLGIAATALGDWKTARIAWTGFGIKLPAGDGPVEMNCGSNPIRLKHPNGDGEVVWASRLCPARARITSIPFPESNHRWRDIVLNDGAPVGYRKYGGQDVPVFNELQLLEASEYGTYIVEAEMDYTQELMTRLMEIATTEGGHAENWTQSIRVLCKACSEGTPHAEHDYAPARDGVQRIAIAAKNMKDANEILKAWKIHTATMSFGKLEEAS